MRKPIEEMTEREMLEELVAEKRREENVRYIKLGLYAALAIAVIILLAIYLPPVIEYFRKLNATVQQIQEGIQQVQNATNGVKETVEGIGASGQEALQSAADKLNELLEKVPHIFR